MLFLLLHPHWYVIELLMQSKYMLSCFLDLGILDIGFKP